MNNIEKIDNAILSTEHVLCEQKLTTNEYKFVLEELVRRLETKIGECIVTPK